MLNKNILFIGAINFGKSPQGGEEFKNQLIVNKLLEDNCKFDFIDTIVWRKSVVTLFKLVIGIFVLNYNKIIISASSKSVYQLIRFIYYVNKKTLNRTTYFVIGGYLPEALKSSIYNPMYYFLLDKIIVEGELLKEKLETLGLSKNVVVVPNFKETIKHQISIQGFVAIKKKRLIYISTISSDKGVDLIFDALRIILQEENKFEYIIDFFGPIETDYKNTFEKKLKEFSDCTSYKGYLDIKNDSKLSYEVMTNYEGLIFPSMYKGEGFAGVFIDAFIAGLPIIATNWNMNEEAVKHGYTGLILEENTPEALAQTISYFIGNDSLRAYFSENSKMAAAEYDINLVFDNNLKGLLV